MAVIGWNETHPSSTSTASTLDDELRSLVSTIATGLGESLYWPGSGATAGSAGSTGQMLLGTARVAIGSNLGVGDAGLGFIAMDSDDTTLWHAGSARTFRWGGPTAAQVDTAPGNAPFTARWVVQSGKITHPSVATVGAASNSSTIAFGTTYNGLPYVFAIPSSNLLDEDVGVVHGVFVSSVTQATSVVSVVDPDGTTFPDNQLGGVDVYWWSIGTVAY